MNSVVQIVEGVLIAAVTSFARLHGVPYSPLLSPLHCVTLTFLKPRTLVQPE